jgi:monoamine oxidase
MSRSLDDGELDVAIVGAGAAGTYLAHRLIQSRPDWRIGLFERSHRIGGRLWSVRVEGLPHPIELGGMRYMSRQPLVQSVVDALGLETRPFNTGDHSERSFLRAVVGNGPDDPQAGSGYDLAAGERGRSAADLMRSAFLQIVPRARELDAVGWRDTRATARFRGRPLTDWSIEEALKTILGAEAHCFATDAFGYDSGIHPHNAGDAIQYLVGSGDPTGEARVPVDGMDRIPRKLAARFEALGGTVWLGRDVRNVEMGEGSVLLGFVDGPGIRARRLVLTTPIRALEVLAAASPLLNGPIWRRLFRSIEGFPATKLYCWYDRPWWRDGDNAPTGVRTTTDLPNRMIFYLDEAPDRRAAILAAFTDRRRTAPIVTLAGGRSGGAPASQELLEALRGWLVSAHPGAGVPARPAGSAFQHWGADPREVAWHFWRAGSNSDDMIELAAQPDPSLPIHICGEVFSRHDAWVEGALGTASTVADRLVAT